jgi:hypothetical protein
MAKIELDMKEYQGMISKIKNLESALNSISTEAAENKETIEKLKALVFDLKNEKFLGRLFRWKSIIEPFTELLKIDGKIQKEKA